MRRLPLRGVHASEKALPSRCSNAPGMVLAILHPLLFLCILESAHWSLLQFWLESLELTDAFEENWHQWVTGDSHLFRLLIWKCNRGVAVYSIPAFWAEGLEKLSKWSSCHGSAERNLTSIHEDKGSIIPGLAQWVKEIWRCREPWCRWQTWLGSGAAVAVLSASGYSSHWTPNLGTSICRGYSPKKTKRKEKENVIEKKLCQTVMFYNLFHLGEKISFAVSVGTIVCIII